MLKMRAFLFLSAWFCVTYQQETPIKSKIQEIFGTPDVSTESPTTAVPFRGDSCDCPADLSALGARNCVCVSHYHCVDTKVVDRHGRGIIDIRTDEDEEPVCPSLQWCCSLDNITDTPIIPDDSKTPGCGWRQPNGVGFRLTGNTDETEFGEFPWMVAILYTEEYEGETILPIYQCGGTLIHPQAVITAAHCVRNTEKKYLVRVGDWDSQSNREIYPSQDRNVKSVVIHPDYYGGAFFNDIAFLLLESPIDMSKPHIGVACLPPQGTTFPGGARCFATGWGKDKYGHEGSYHVILKKINLPIVEKNICEKNLRRTRLGNSFGLDKSFICAGGELGKDTCKGDGGSPLSCPVPTTKNKYQLAGIVSWGIGCGEDGIPAAYTDVALFRDWIDQQVINNKLDTSTYTS